MMDSYNSRILQHFLTTDVNSIFLEILFLASVWLGGRVVYNLYFHPLSRLPSPPFASITPLALIYYSHYDLRTETLAKWHRIYGPVVRVGPNEVSFTSEKAIKEIYQDPEMEKYKPLYGIFQHFGADNAFTSRTRYEHGWRRKGVADRYTLTYVMREEERDGKIRRKAGDYCDYIEKEGLPIGEGVWEVDLYAANIFYATDNITSHLFGEQLGSHALRRWHRRATDLPILSQTETMRDRIFSHYGAALRSKVYLYVAFPAVMNGIDHIRGFLDRIRARTNIVSGLDKMREFGWTRHQQLREMKDRQTVSGKLANLAEEGSGWSHEIAVSELMDHILAGMDTTSDTLSFLMYHISKPSNFQIQNALRNELRSEITESPYKTPLSFIILLPYLSAIVFETLRFYTAIPVTLPRIVAEQGKYIEGILMPVGTIVGSLAAAIHGDEEIYANYGEWPVDKFIPERWIARKGVINEEERIKRMEKRLWAFGSGARGCVGRHLAIVEIKVLLAVVYWSYTTVVVEETDIKLRHK